jgi:hypothetical protein
MAKVVITFEDIEGIGVNVSVDFSPKVCVEDDLTPAQALALQSLENAKKLGEE